MKKYLLVLLLSVANLALAQDPVTVPTVDLDRYVGKWFEIARFPNRFQTQCTGEVSAEYVKRADGNIEVINRCAKTDGSMDQAIGEARVVDSVSRAKLKVRFAPAWLSWVPFVWGDYWILDLAADYSTVAVGDPSRKYLWILARTKSLPAPVYDNMVAKLAAQGFDVAALVKTRQ
jgi:apolipoprotein D and lipocalin family protein